MTNPESAAAAAARARDVALRASPEARRRGGVVHTPARLARFLLSRAADALVAAGGPEALDGATLVDPACGTGVFPAAALGLGLRPAAIVGIDVDAGALASARGALAAPCEERGVALSLREADALTSLSLADELGDAPAVIVGNPPWAARASSRGVAASDALVVALRPSGERRAGILSDAYVRFLAWTCALAERWRAPLAVALVTNGSFLDGPVHALLRAKLASTFDGLDVVDLGGGALVARSRGSRDEGLFAVRPPAAVTIAWKTADPARARTARVRVATLRGSRDEKESALASGALAFTEVTDVAVALAPAAPRPRGWERFTSVAALFPFHREGVQSNRDALVVDADRDVLLARLRAFAAGAHDTLAPARPHFSPDAARRALVGALDDGTLDASIVPLAYRPLDRRFVCTHPAVCHRARPELLAALAHGGVALVSARKDRGTAPWAHFGASSVVPDNCWLSTRSSCRARAFPAHAPDGAPNVEARAWEDALGHALPFDVLLPWVLAVLASPSYRAAADAVLRQDYPRVPAPRDRSTLDAVVVEGHALRAVLDAPLPSGVDDAVVVGRVRLTPGGGRVDLGAELSLDASPAALELRIGHVDVVRSYLRARVGARVSRTTLGALLARADEVAARVARLDAVVVDALDLAPHAPVAGAPD